MHTPAIQLAKLLSSTTRRFNLGNGSTWPGHLMLKHNPHFLREVFAKNPIPIVLIAGTNGKTTVSKLLRHILEVEGKIVLHNESGANLASGIASSLLLNMTSTGKLRADYAILEVDENALPVILSEITPAYLVILNLFRDQLDRYGEVDAVANHWGQGISKLTASTTIILNADDPQVAFFATNTKAKTVYFGLEGKKSHAIEHASDSAFCPRCGHKLTYNSNTFSHLGDWHCDSCHFNRPKLTLAEASVYPLSGTYNKYNTIAAVLAADRTGVPKQTIQKALHSFSPAFGRQEELLYQGVKVKMFLSKNPTGLNESLRTVAELQGKSLLLALNDGYADGTDVSWIWDVDFEDFLPQFGRLTLTGDRTYDLALRVFYAMDRNAVSFLPVPDIQDALQRAVLKIGKDEVLYILPTYTAMLALRKIITGKKIL